MMIQSENQSIYLLAEFRQETKKPIIHILLAFGPVKLSWPNSYFLIDMKGRK